MSHAGKKILNFSQKSVVFSAMSSALWMSEIEKAATAPSPVQVWHQSSYELFSRKDNVVMTKTLDLITEIIRNPKHPFHQTDDRPAKEQKNRYERRKVKEIIKLGNWAQEDTA